MVTNFEGAAPEFSKQTAYIYPVGQKNFMIESSFQEPKEEKTVSYSESLVKDLLSQGYVLKDDKLFAPETEYTTYQDRKLRQLGKYSPDVYELNASGQVVKKTSFAPSLVEASSTGGWVIYEAKASSVSSYDYGAGQIKTEFFDNRTNTFLNIQSKVDSEIKRGLRSSEPLIVTQKRQADLLAREQASFIGGSDVARPRARIKTAYGSFVDVDVSPGVALKLQGLDPQNMSYDPYGKAVRVQGFIPVASQVAREKKFLDPFTNPYGLSVQREGKTEYVPFNETQRLEWRDLPKQTRQSMIDSRPPWKTSAKSEPVQFAFQVASGAGEFVASPFIGAGKVALIGAPRPKDLFNPFKAISDRNVAFVQAFKSDQDVQSAGIVAGLAMVASTGPLAAAVVEVGGIGLGSYEMGKGFLSGDPKRVGEGGVMVAAGKPFSKARRGFVEIFGERQAPETVFADFSGKPSSSRTLSQGVAAFEFGRLPSGKVEVVTASPTMLEGSFVEVRGRKGKALVEDPVQYFGPKGAAQIGFTGIEGSKPLSSEVSFNPLESFKSSQPSVSSFVVSDIVRYPRSAINEPGFGTPGQMLFLEKVRQAGAVVITKRSEIGKGVIPRQYFSPKESVKAWGKNYEPGKFYIEPGTIENEVGAVKDTPFIRADKTFKEQMRFTVVNQQRALGFDIPFTGDLVRLPKYELVGDVSVLGKSARRKVTSAEEVFSFESEANRAYGSERSSRGVNYASFGFSEISSASSSLPSSDFGSSRSFIPSSSRGGSLGSFSERSSVEYFDVSGFSGKGSSKKRGFEGFSGLSRSPGRGSSFVSVPFASSPGGSEFSPFSEVDSFESVPSDFFIDKREGIDKKAIPESKLVLFQPKYFSSVEASAFGITGKRPSSRAISLGVDIRPILKK